MVQRYVPLIKELAQRFRPEFADHWGRIELVHYPLNQWQNHTLGGFELIDSRAVSASFSFRNCVASHRWIFQYQWNSSLHSQICIIFGQQTHSHHWEARTPQRPWNSPLPITWGFLWWSPAQYSHSESFQLQKTQRQASVVRIRGGRWEWPQCFQKPQTFLP